MKKGNYQSRRLKRKIHRFFWVLIMRLRVGLWLAMHRLLISILVINDFLFKRTLRVKRYGITEEAVRER